MRDWRQSLETSDPEEAANIETKHKAICSMLLGIVSLVNGELEELSQFALQFGTFDPEMVQSLASLLKGKIHLFIENIESPAI